MADNERNIDENNSENNLTKLKSLREDYNKIFNSEEGKRVMADLENTGFYNTTTFVSKDEMATVYNEGLRSFLLHIKTIKDMPLEALERIANAYQK